MTHRTKAASRVHGIDPPYKKTDPVIGVTTGSVVYISSFRQVLQARLLKGCEIEIAFYSARHVSSTMLSATKRIVNVTNMIRCHGRTVFKPRAMSSDSASTVGIRSGSLHPYCNLDC